MVCVAAHDDDGEHEYTHDLIMMMTILIWQAIMINDGQWDVWWVPYSRIGSDHL